jgi:hypothetical protein
MNIAAPFTLPEAEAIAVPHADIPDLWTVTVDGNTRTITRDGSGFIAWIGCQFKCWSFEGARKQCVEDIEYQQHLASVVKTVPVMGAEEVALLAYSDAYDASDRMARARQEQP